MQSLPFQNRELTWLEFNQRVLDQAADERLPLLERIKFLAITGSNLDEFFLIRMGGLTMLAEAGSRKRDLAGYTPKQQLRLARQRVELMVQQQMQLLTSELLPALATEGIRQLSIRDLPQMQFEHLRRYFENVVAPLVTTLSIREGKPVARPPALQLMLGCQLLKLRKGKKARARWAIITIPHSLDRFVPVPTKGEGTFDYVLLEDVVAHFASQLFPGEAIGETAAFRITRNADIAVEEEGAHDLSEEMEAVLAARRSSRTVRLEVSKGCPRQLLAQLKNGFEVEPKMIYRNAGPLHLGSYMQLATLPEFDHLKDEPWSPQNHPGILPDETIFETLDRRDLLLYHPYDSFDPVLQLLEQAAEDDKVLAIKQTLYRTAKDSRVTDALIRAAENGKEVTVVVELKARFDEARNLSRSDELEAAGVQLIQGVKGYKTHSKVLMVVRQESKDELRTYLHLGTGNYNETTARLYTDISYLTSKPEYGSEAAAYFNAVTGEAEVRPGVYLHSSPHHMRRCFLDLIAHETEAAKAGKPARIIAKVNSLQDREIIAALYKASHAGVQIQLNVRGICCLLPGLKKFSQNIEVTSIIDRYLEHARIYYFHQRGNPVVFISSADWMERNLDRRIELLVQIEDSDSKRRLIKLLKRHFKDNQQAYRLESDGTYTRIKRKSGAKRFRAQQEFYERVRARINEARATPDKMLKPYKKN